MGRGEPTNNSRGCQTKKYGFVARTREGGRGREGRSTTKRSGQLQQRDKKRKTTNKSTSMTPTLIKQYQEQQQTTTNTITTTARIRTTPLTLHESSSYITQANCRLDDTRTDKMRRQEMANDEQETGDATDKNSHK